MRHATQARFDRVARMGLRPAYTVQQMEHWTETDWNWHVRLALQGCGYKTFHIREASETGVADLIVYHQRVIVTDRPEFNHKEGQMPLQVIDAWIELKKDNDRSDSNVRPSQKEFMRAHWNEARNALFVMFDRKVGMLAVHQGDLRGRVKMIPAYPYGVDWRAVFEHFKSRK